MDPSTFLMYYNYEIYLNQDHNHGEKKVIYNEKIPLVPCKNNSLVNTSMFVHHRLNTFYCPEYKNSNVSLGGDRTEDGVTVFELVVEQCSAVMEKQYNVVCDRDFFSNNKYYIGVVVLDYVYDRSNYLMPIDKRLKYDVKSIDYKISKSYRIGLSKIFLENDICWISKESNTTSYITNGQINSDVETYDYNYEDPKQSRSLNYIFKVRYTFTKKVNIISRSYRKLQDILSTIGGFMSIAIFFFQEIYNLFFLDFIYNYQLFNAVFDFKIDQDAELEIKEEEVVKKIPKYILRLRNKKKLSNIPLELKRQSIFQSLSLNHLNFPQNSDRESET